jgi:hypothetical protein
MKKKLGKKWDTGDFIGDFVNLGFPCEVQDAISGILTEINRQGDDVTPYLKDLEPLDREVEEFIKEHLDIYLEHLEAQLKKSIKKFVPSNYLDEWDFENHIGIRSSFESYLHELEKYHRDTREYRKQITVLDEEFKRSIPLAVKEKLYLPNDQPWAPKEYWWLHLEEQYGYPDEFID